MRGSTPSPHRFWLAESPDPTLTRSPSPIDKARGNILLRLAGIANCLRSGNAASETSERGVRTYPCKSTGSSAPTPMALKLFLNVAPLGGSVVHSIS